MNSIDESDNSKQTFPEKILGKKIKRFKTIINPLNNLSIKTPPKLSPSTLLQIEKIHKNKRKTTQKAKYFRQPTFFATNASVYSCISI